LSYEMVDCVDQFVLADSESDAKVAFADEISGFRIRVAEVMERYYRFKLGYVLSCPTVINKASACPRLRRASGDTNRVALVGIECQINELVGLLKPNNGGDERELQLKVLSILGVEGVGKSTIAQELWRVLGEEFECRAFVHAAKKPNMRLILTNILLQIRPNHPPEVCRVPNLIQDITNHLQDKRYCIMVDDLWAVSVWETISRAFPEGNCCSRIITTTTIEDVALACCSYDPEHVFKMKPLSYNHSKDLLIRTVFGSGNECPQQLHDVSDKITRTCCGLPLAVTCIASLLATKPQIVHQWEYVQNLLCDSLTRNPTSVEILKQVLNICYTSLPHSLKTCLLYLSVYPENYLILKYNLVRQWVAEDFIDAMENKDTIEVATSYFDELVSLGLIQRLDISCNEKGMSYLVHPVVFEFIKCKSIEDNFITIIDYSQSAVALTEKIRRLSLHFGSATYATTPESIEPLHVRSLSFMGLLNSMPSLVDFKLVRVIILHVLVDNECTSFPLTGICQLLLLRYLQVRCNVTVELPDKIGCLKHLEILEIHESVAGVPTDIDHLPILKKLCLGRKRYCMEREVLKIEDSNGEYDDPIENLVKDKEIEDPNERDEVLKIQHGAHKDELSSDEDELLGKIQGDDMKKHAIGRVMKLASKRAVVMFTLSNCCLSHTVKSLMAELGVAALVYDLDSVPRGKEMERALSKMIGGERPIPAIFIGGRLVGGVNNVMSLHLSGKLVPMLKRAGAISIYV